MTDSGQADAYTYPCPACKGTGQVSASTKLSAFREGVIRTKPCVYCGGSGRKPR